MLSNEDILFFRNKLKDSARPLFFFDDDADGVSSFVLMYKLVGDGKGICVKGKPVLESFYSKKVEEYSPDRVFILDKPLVEQEFLDEVTQEVLWLDHHPPQNNKGVKYFNPRVNNSEDNRPTSYWSYLICKDDVPDALWIAGIGVIGDWSLALKDELCEKYPDLLPASVSSAPEALFGTEFGKLVKIIDFNLKGTTTQVMQAVKILTRVEDPYEILNQTSSQGKYLYKKFLAINEKYEALMSGVISAPEDPLILFKYSDTKLAISSMLSNELLFKYPGKIIIVAREKADELMLSIRSSEVNVAKVLEVALCGIDGYGGGHDNACGACVKQSDFDAFLKAFREALSEAK